MLVLGVDPGSTTGVAILETVGLEVVFHSLQGSEVGQALAFGVLLDSFESGQIGQIVIEDFLIAGRNISTTARAALSPVRVGAMCQLQAVLRGFECIEFQLASFAKNHMPDQRLRKLGFQGGNVHERDALRHCLAWGRKNGVNLSYV